MFRGKKEFLHNLHLVVWKSCKEVLWAFLGNCIHPPHPTTLAFLAGISKMEPGTRRVNLQYCIISVSSMRTFWWLSPNLTCSVRAKTYVPACMYAHGSTRYLDYVNKYSAMQLWGICDFVLPRIHLWHWRMKKQVQLLGSEKCGLFNGTACNLDHITVPMTGKQNHEVC